jgi:hypothetical protein
MYAQSQQTGITFIMYAQSQQTGITFIMYAQSQQTGKTNNIKIFGNKKTQGFQYHQNNNF